MQYKTIIHELLQQRPQMHEQLRKDRQPTADAGTLRQGTEDQPRGVEGDAPPDAPGQRPEPDRQRGPGIGPEGNRGTFAGRFPGPGDRPAGFSTPRCCSSGIIVARLNGSETSNLAVRPAPQATAITGTPAMATGQARRAPPLSPPRCPRPRSPPAEPQKQLLPRIASGEKAKARDIIAAIRTLEAHRAGAAAGHARRNGRRPRPLRRLRAGGPVDLSRSGHRPLQGCRLAGPRRGAEIPADARGIRQRQAHHLQRLLHVADRHRGHARGHCPPRRARERHRPGARLRHRQFHEPWPPRACASSASRLDSHLRPHRPGAPPRPRHPHREFPRHQAARRTASTR